jgi:hypothetical protein
LLLVKVYRISFASLGRIYEHVPFGLVGYLLFCLLTMPTLDTLVSTRGMLYLALTLALLSQASVPGQQEQEIA